MLASERQCHGPDQQGRGNTRPQDCLQVQWWIHAEAKKEVLVLALRPHAVRDWPVLQSWHTSLASLMQREYDRWRV